MSETEIETNSIDAGTIRPYDPLVDLAAGIATAFLENSANRSSIEDIPNLLSTSYKALVGLGQPEAPAAAEDGSEELTLDPKKPAEIKKSITDEALISFIDGKPYKTLKRHLSRHGLTPETYRQKFGLPVDYPMTSASYSEQRSALAKAGGLGTRRTAEAA